MVDFLVWALLNLEHGMRSWVQVVYLGGGCRKQEWGSKESERDRWKEKPKWDALSSPLLRAVEAWSSRNWENYRECLPQIFLWKDWRLEHPPAPSHHQMRTAPVALTPSHPDLYLPGRRDWGRMCLTGGAGSTWWDLTHMHLPTTVWRPPEVDHQKVTQAPEAPAILDILLSIEDMIFIEAFTQKWTPYKLEMAYCIFCSSELELRHFNLNITYVMLYQLECFRPEA